jgi:cobalt-zinc-cadmium efflux system outer membrane protein
MVEVPLFDRNQGNIRTARADIASSRAVLRNTELDLATQAAQAIAGYRTSQRLVAWYERYILPKARETLQITQRLYARGEVTFLSLLQAQRILTETELAFVEAQSDRWTGAVTIASLLQVEEFPPPPEAAGGPIVEGDVGGMPPAAGAEGVPLPPAAGPPRQFPDEPPVAPLPQP